MTTRKRILYVSPFPYSTSSGDGGATACASALELLQDHFDVGMVCFSRETPGEKISETQLRKSLNWFRTIPLRINKFDVIKAKLGSLTLNPEQSAYYNQADMRSAIQEEIEHIKPDVVIYQFPQMAQFICRHHQNALNVMDVQDAFSVSAFRKIATAGNLTKMLYAALQWIGWIHYEKKHYQKFDQVWTLSKQDAYGLTAFSPSLHPRVLGLPLQDPGTVPISTQATKADFRVGFIGSFSHPPNIEAVEFICKEIAPRFKPSDVTFVLAGRNPPEHLLKQAPSNVKFLGFVEHLSDFYDSVDIIVAPLFSGGGIKIKVAEALLHSKAIVTTAIGAEGLDLQNGRHVLLASHIDDFVAHIEALRTSKPQRSQLALQARLHATEHLAREQWLVRALGHLSTPT